MRRRANILTLSLFALASTLAGCAASGGPEEQGTETRRSIGTDCFTVSLARDFRYLDDRNLIVFAPARRAHHVELSYACMGLRGEMQIALRSRTDRMCGFAGDTVIVDGAFTQRCPVLSVRRLDDDQLQALIAELEPEAPVDEGVEVEIPAEE